MAAAEEFFFDVEEEDWAEDGSGEGKEENSTDPQNRTHAKNEVQTSGKGRVWIRYVAVPVPE